MSAPTRGKTAYVDIPARELRRLYVAQRMSTLEIAKLYGCGKKTVRFRMIEHGIKRRTLTEAFSVSSSHGLALRGRGESALSWRGGTRKNEGYVMIYCPDHPYAGKAGYVMEHRLVIEKAIGRHLMPGEEVHHRNENRGDNRIENLELMTKSEHRAHHARKKWARHRESRSTA